MDYLTKDQVQDILRAAYDSPRDHLMLLLSFNHGLRRSEVARLRVQDVQNGLIRVARLKGSMATSGPLRASEDVLFDEPKALARWLKARRTDTNSLFLGDKQGQFVARAAIHAMATAGVAPELAHHHSLKHACCSIQARNGVGIEYIAQHVGHKDIKSTRIYLHITGAEAAQKAWEALS